jgi:molybdopterin molybdotransferase
MDGFAVVAVDTLGSNKQNPTRLRIAGDIPAGSDAEYHLKRGQAIRVMTGAPVPSGADAVVPVEQTNIQDRNPGGELPIEVEIQQAVASGSYVRQKGEDFRIGEKILEKGHRIRAQDVGILAMLGKAKLSVYRQPIIGFLSTGDELLNLDEPLVPGKIRDTNSYTIQALVDSCYAIPLSLGVAKDNEKDVQEKLDSAVSQGVDMIISTAGVSVGAYDFVRLVVEKHGEIIFWRVNMRPGKPLVYGAFRDIPFVGLPGNPVSAFVGFEVFLRAAIARMSGEIGWGRTTHIARLARSVNSDGRESYLRAVLSEVDGVLTANLTGQQSSGNLLSLALADGLVVIPAGVKHLEKGGEVQAWYL